MGVDHREEHADADRAADHDRPGYGQGEPGERGRIGPASRNSASAGPVLDLGGERRLDDVRCLDGPGPPAGHGPRNRSGARATTITIAITGIRRPYLPVHRLHTGRVAAGRSTCMMRAAKRETNGSSVPRSALDEPVPGPSDHRRPEGAVSRAHSQVWAPALVVAVGLVPWLRSSSWSARRSPTSACSAGSGSADDQVSTNLAAHRTDGWNSSAPSGPTRPRRCRSSSAACSSRGCWPCCGGGATCCWCVIGLAVELATFLIVNEIVRRERPSVDEARHRADDLQLPVRSHRGDDRAVRLDRPAGHAARCGRGSPGPAVGPRADGHRSRWATPGSTGACTTSPMS